MSKLTKESDWAEWKQECAFELCNEKAQERLGKFCSMRLFNSSKGCSPKTFLEISEQLGIKTSVLEWNELAFAYMDDKQYDEAIKIFKDLVTNDRANKFTQIGNELIGV